MCPVCIASTAVMVGAGSAGGILAVCMAKCRKFFRASRPNLFQSSWEK
jgi:hypothetical protein